MSHFGRLLLGARITEENFLSRIGVSQRTGQRWRRHGHLPRAVVLLLQAMTGQLEYLHPDWAGWSIGRDGRLYSPEGLWCTPGDVRAIPWRLAHIGALERELREAQQPTKKEGRYLTFQ